MFWFMLILFSCYSGEKTSADEWPGSLEIKGRVRLDAFEKFLQELPLSRSRAVMVPHVSFHCIFVSYYSKSRERKKRRITVLFLLIPLLVFTQHRVFSYANDIYFRLMRSCMRFGMRYSKLKEKKIFLWINNLNYTFLVFPLTCHVCSSGCIIDYLVKVINIFNHLNEIILF
jgi:hypothetical protein